MMLRDLTDKARALMPWNWGKRPVRVRDERSTTALPARREDFRNMFEDLFEDFLGRWPGGGPLAPFAEPAEMQGAQWPRVDLEETEDELRITAELPGMEADDVEVTMGDRSLTVRGSKTTRSEDRKKGYHIMETHSGSFNRTIPLPADVDPGGVEAVCRSGQMTVTVPKTGAGPGVKKIEVKQ